jgi:4-aminobutyrate aminotransferase-like enzyme
LRELQQRFPIIGDVRGKGLMIGVELVKDRQTKAYAAAETTRLVEEMRKRGVLIGKGGRFGNILRIQPPLIFSSDDCTEFLRAIEESLAAVCA